MEEEKWLLLYAVTVSVIAVVGIVCNGNYAWFIISRFFRRLFTRVPPHEIITMAAIDSPNGRYVSPVNT